MEFNSSNCLLSVIKKLFVVCAAVAADQLKSKAALQYKEQEHDDLFSGYKPYVWSSPWSHVFTFVVNNLCMNVTFIMCEPVAGNVLPVNCGKEELVLIKISGVNMREQQKILRRFSILCASVMFLGHLNVTGVTQVCVELSALQIIYFTV